MPLPDTLSIALSVKVLSEYAFFFCAVSFFFPANKLSKTEPFAVSHLRLMKPDDTAITDGPHELYVYNVSNHIVIIV